MYISNLFSISFILSVLPAFTAAQSASTEYTSDTTFRSANLDISNIYRKQHNASSLVWNETLATSARKWSEKCGFEHSGGAYGENLASGYANVSTSVIVWGNERTVYDFGKGDFSSATGHFTQLVWKVTTSVGCGRTFCNAGQDGGKGDAPGWYVVCQYWPQGNVIGKFKENVQERVKGTSDSRVPDDKSAAGRARGGLGVVLGVAVACWLVGGAGW